MPSPNLGGTCCFIFVLYLLQVTSFLFSSSPTPPLGLDLPQRRWDQEEKGSVGEQRLFLSFCWVWSQGRRNIKWHQFRVGRISSLRGPGPSMRKSGVVWRSNTDSGWEKTQLSNSDASHRGGKSWKARPPTPAMNGFLWGGKDLPAIVQPSVQQQIIKFLLSVGHAPYWWGKENSLSLKELMI